LSVHCKHGISLLSLRRYNMKHGWLARLWAERAAWMLESFRNIYAISCWREGERVQIARHNYSIHSDRQTVPLSPRTYYRPRYSCCVCVCVCIVGVPNPQWLSYLPSDTVNSLRIFLAAVVRLEHLCAKFASGEICRRHRVIPIQKCK
jgi:hypothetical protein